MRGRLPTFYLKQVLQSILKDLLGVRRVDIIPMWSVLATKRPVLYGICVVAVEACLAYRLGQIPYPNSNADVLTMAFVATQAMSVVISLLVVRSWGYRLMPMRSCCPVVEESPK